jgi:hypothetical protein
MTGWLVDLLINEFIHHNFEVMAVFRFHQDYVNFLFFLIFYTMLHNLSFGWIAEDDVITGSEVSPIFISFFWQSNMTDLARVLIVLH